MAGVLTLALVLLLFSILFGAAGVWSRYKKKSYTSYLFTISFLFLSGGAILFALFLVSFR